MATSVQTISREDGYVLMAAAGDDFLIENKGKGPIRFALAGAAPALDTKAFHWLGAGMRDVRVGTGALYVYSLSEAPSEVVVTV